MNKSLFIVSASNPHSITKYISTTEWVNNYSQIDIQANAGDLIVGVISNNGSSTSFTLDNSYTVLQEFEIIGSLQTKPCIFTFKASTTGLNVANVTFANYNGGTVALWALNGATEINLISDYQYTLASDYYNITFTRNNAAKNLWIVSANANSSSPNSTSATVIDSIGRRELLTFLENDAVNNQSIMVTPSSGNRFYPYVPNVTCIEVSGIEGKIQSDTLTNIADAIREKNGETGGYLPSQMSEKIRALQTAPSISEMNKDYLFYYGARMDIPYFLSLAASAKTVGSTYAKGADSTFCYAIQDTTADNAYQASGYVIDRLGRNMFDNCSYLTNVQFSPTFTTAENYGSGSYQQTFRYCYRLSAEKVVETVVTAIKNGALYLSSTYNNQKYTGSMFYGLGSYIGVAAGNIGDLVFPNDVYLGSSMFDSTNIKKINSITAGGILENQPIFSKGFQNCSYLEYLGKITITTYDVKHYDYWNGDMISNCLLLKYFGGFDLQNQSTEILRKTNQTIFSRSQQLKALEELENMPISYFTYGAGSLGRLYGNGVSGYDVNNLRRLVFNTTNIPYVNKTADKSFSIAYCSFDRAGMVEMFNSLPDANDVTGAKNITITGNPCVTNGTLTAEDMAIATNKGYTLTT